ncbi:MAG TPA: hypothetical protein VI685_08845 [Candidatus Angelobacter sp.]
MFEQELEKLATAIRTEVVKYKKAHSVQTRRYVRVRRRDFSLKYRLNPAFANFAPTRIEEDAWDWSDEERFQNSVVKSLKEYDSLVSVLGQNAASVEGFARSLCFVSFHGLGDDELKERVNAFGHELAGEPLPVSVIAFIDGISIPDSPLAIADNLILRQPTPDDLAEDILVDEYGGFSFPLGETWFSVVGEFVFDAISTGCAQEEFLRVAEALRLFRVGGITTTRYRMRSRHSYLQGGVGTLSGGGPGHYSPFTYTLISSDTAALKKFLADVAPLLPNPLQLDKAATEKEIAYTRYRDALFQGGPSEKAITSAMTALEALFLKGEPELTHRLAQRVAVFLRVLGTQPDAQNTYDKVKKGYKIRSTFIHGSSSNDQAGSDAIAPVLLEYARECVLAYFQTATSKSDLLNQLDEAMIDPACADIAASLAHVVHK